MSGKSSTEENGLLSSISNAFELGRKFQSFGNKPDETFKEIEGVGSTGNSVEDDCIDLCTCIDAIESCSSISIISDSWLMIGTSKLDCCCVNGIGRVDDIEGVCITDIGTGIHLKLQCD